MPIEKGCLKDWDDRHYQSIDDLPPEAWDSVRDKRLAEIEEVKSIIRDGKVANMSPIEIAQMIIAAGFKRD